MKKLFSLALTVLAVTLVIAVIPTEAECAIYEDTVRLHILANSDSEEDQALKLKIRDDILAEFSDELSNFEGSELAKRGILASLDEIEEFAELKIAEYGYYYPVSVSFGEERYETREYDGFTLPAGRYDSLRVVIGEGEGKNWWCVMYPPLCLDMALDNTPADDAIKKYNENEVYLISGNGYQAKFKILEVVSGIFS